ncbi:MAG: hypothetical protein PHU08_06015 [Dehalococcoidales bacterium]|nr:hypothetical protein [Dehalococcoidales bacterium]
MEGTSDRATDHREEMSRIYEEYKQKFAAAIEKETKSARERARQESLSIIAEAQHLAEETLVEARKKADLILVQARTVADEIIGEAERCAKAVGSLKQCVVQESSTVTSKVRSELDLIIEAAEKCQEEITEAEHQACHEFEESLKAINEMRDRLGQLKGTDQPVAKKAGDRSVPPTARTIPTAAHRETVVAPVTPSDIKHSKESKGELSVGTLEIHISPPGDSAQLQRVVNRLSQTPGLEVSRIGGASGDKTRVTVFAPKPLPLLKILKEMASVKQAVRSAEGIQVVLQASDVWVG